MSTTAALYRITIPGVSPRLWLASEEHLESVVRELQLIGIGFSEGTAGVAPQRVLDLLTELLATYASPRSAVRRQVEDALEAGEETVDLVLEVPPEAAAAGRQFLTLMEEADRLAGQGLLLNLCARPEVREFRRAFVDAVAAALDDATRR